MPVKFTSHLLKLGLLSVLIGRGLFLLLWDAPYRAILWDEQLLSGLINRLGSWESWASSSALDQGIVLFSQLQGITLLVTAVLIFLPWRKLSHLFLLISSFHLFLLGFAGYWNSHHQVGYFFEYALQIAIPLAYILYQRDKTAKAIQLLAASTALTFFGHGLYAIGYYMRPGRFVDMVLAILPVQESSAHQLLFFAGSFDLLLFTVLIIALMIPKKIPANLVIKFLVMASFWGFATAFARWFAYVEWQMLWQTALMWGPQVAYRLVHGFVPLWLLYQWRGFAANSSYQQTPFKASILSV